MANRRDIQFFYTPHNKPKLIDCYFTVAATNGLGITSLNQGGRIATVFGHTSTTPAVDSVTGLTNPNPQAGVMQVILQDNYYKYLDNSISMIAPASGTPIVVTAAGAALTVGNLYQITALGTTTTANWITLGVPAYITPAVGVSFIAAATGAGTGTGAVQAPKSGGAGIDHVEVYGNPNIMQNSSGMIMGAGVGMFLNLICYKNGTITQPADGTIISLKFYLNDSFTGV